MHRYLVIIEKAEHIYTAYSPDLPGCTAIGADAQEAERNIRDAIELHIQGLLDEGLPIPESRSFAEYVTVVEEVDSN